MKQRPRLSEKHILIAIGALRGASRGGLAGAALAVVTGTAVTVSVPGSVPVIGGLWVIKSGTVVAWWITGSIFEFIKSPRFRIKTGE